MAVSGTTPEREDREVRSSSLIQVGVWFDFRTGNSLSSCACILELLVDVTCLVPLLGLAVDFQQRPGHWQSHPLPDPF